jgi:hypothetical protein
MCVSWLALAPRWWVRGLGVLYVCVQAVTGCLVRVAYVWSAARVAFACMCPTVCFGRMDVKSATPAAQTDAVVHQLLG